MKKYLIILIVFLLLICILILNMNIPLTDNTDNNSNNWTYDKKEYPKSEYTLEDLPVSHKSAYELRQFFEDSDINHDGILKDQEINDFDYKIKHSQYTFNGPYGYN